MALNCGIVGLPNVGKSTIFSALTSAKAEAANYPFCTIDPNVGVVAVPDPRLDKLVAMFSPKRRVPAAGYRCSDMATAGPRVGCIRNARN